MKSKKKLRKAVKVKKIKKPAAPKAMARQRKKLVKKPKKLKVVKKAKKVQPAKLSVLAESFFKAKIKVIGIGGGGGSIVSEIGKSLNKATFMVADTDARAFKKRAGIKNFLFGQKLTHGLGTGVNPQLGRQAAESEKERIKKFFQDQDIVIFIASLGGGVGSGATQVFAEAAKDFNGISLGIFTLPFKFEGANKYKIALRSLHELRKVLNVSITIPNERIFKVIEANTAITDAFSMVNKGLIESLESLIDLISTQGIINIDFADLRAILSGRGNVAFLNTQEAVGKNRAEEIAQKILHNPLYQNNNFYPEKILFNIMGGPSLGMFEVDRISKAIFENNKTSKIIFGISKNAKFKNKVKVTLLMTGQSQESKQEELKVLAQQEEIKKELAKKAVARLKKPVKILKKVVKKPKKVVKAEPKIPVMTIPAVNEAEFSNQPQFNRINITEPSINRQETTEVMQDKNKKTIRRSALEIKKEQEEKEKEQSVQEKEWEIPAFLRLKK